MRVPGLIAKVFATMWLRGASRCSSVATEVISIPERCSPSSARVRNRCETISGSGEKTVQGLLTITGANDNNRLLGGARLRVAGGAVWDASSRVLVAEGSRIVNEAGSVFDIRNSQRFEHWFSTVSTFENHGTLLKSAGAGQSQVDMIYTGDGR